MLVGKASVDLFSINEFWRRHITLGSLMQQTRLKSRGTIFTKSELLVPFLDDVNIIGGNELGCDIPQDIFKHHLSSTIETWFIPKF